MTPEADPVTAPRPDDPATVAAARDAAREAVHALAALDDHAATGGTVTPGELTEARALVDIARAGVAAAERQHAADVEQARRAGLAELAADVRAAQAPDLAPLLAAVTAAVRAYRDAATDWTTTVAALTRRADALDAPAPYETRPDAYSSPVRLMGASGEGARGGLTVGGVVYGWTRSPETELARAVDDGRTPGGLPTQTPRPSAARAA